MDTILYYIFVGICIYWGMRIFIKVFGFYWSKGYDARKQAREKKKAEKDKWKHCRVRLDNPILNQLTNEQSLMIYGGKGSGKTTLASVVAYFHYMKQLQKDQKNRRMNHYLRPQYISERQQLLEARKLPIYTNMQFRDYETDSASQELWPYVTQQKRAVYNALIIWDDVNEILGKDVWYQYVQNPTEEMKKMEDYGARSRQYNNAYWIFTDQSGSDVCWLVRKSGYVEVQTLGQIVSISKKGKVLRALRNFFLRLRPGWLVTGFKKHLQKQVSGKLSRFWAGVKLIVCPAYYSCPKEYYIKRVVINDKIRWKYDRYQLRFLWRTGEYYIRFTNLDKFVFDTNERRKRYEDRFDAEGNAIQ